MKKSIWLGILLSFMLPASVLCAEVSVAERDLKTQRIPIVPQKEKVSIISYNEYGWVHLNSRIGNWKYVLDRVSYAIGDSAQPYVEFNMQERFSLKNYAVNFGSYFNFKDNSYFHSEFGLGADIDYIYRFQTTQEYGHKLYKNFYWQTGYRFINYAAGDVNIFSPGLYYYFGNHYISAFYNISFTEKRGSAQWGNLKGNFALFNNRLNLWLGTAIGQRLYDILTIKANRQNGFIAFLGADYAINKNLNIRLGYSYSYEKPDFIKRGLDYGCVIKF